MFQRNWPCLLKTFPQPRRDETKTRSRNRWSWSRCFPEKILLGPLVACKCNLVGLLKNGLESLPRNNFQNWNQNSMLPPSVSSRDFISDVQSPWLSAYMTTPGIIIQICTLDGYLLPSFVGVRSGQHDKTGIPEDIYKDERLIAIFFHKVQLSMRDKKKLASVSISTRYKKHDFGHIFW